MRAISKLEECSRIATASITSLDDPSIGNRLNNRESSLLAVQPTVPITGFSRGFNMNLKPVPRLDSKEASPESQGENDPGVRCFWYSPMMIISDGKMKKNEDWGIHVESDCFAELSAVVAGQMEEDGVVNAEYLAMDLCFLFGFDHEYFHHCTDSALTSHLQRIFEVEGSIPEESKIYSTEYSKRIDKEKKNWILVEETLANAHIVRDPTRLGGLREAFLRYGLLPQPDDWKRGPYALWDRAAFDPRVFNALCHFVWLQYLTGKVDPCDIWSKIEQICDEGGNDAGFEAVVNEIVQAVYPEEIEKDDLTHVMNRDGASIPISFGGFQQGLLRRLEVPLRVHGSQSTIILERYGMDNPEWPYGIIEGLYSHFRIAEVPNESDDPFGDDDDFELIP